jgi:SAM-dependent methyltransferase
MDGRDEFYDKNYKKLLNEGLIGFVGGLVHRNMEPSTLRENHLNNVLELGAGQGQHLNYVNHSFDTYHETDIRVSNLPKRDKSEFNLIQEAIDAQDLPYSNSFFDRVIATCLLAHLDFPEKSLNECKRVTKNNGLITIYVPCEPGLLLRAARYISTVQKSKKLGVDHLSIHYREHRNYFISLNLLIMEVFYDCKISRKFWPLIVPSWNLNFGVVYQIKVNKQGD